MHVTERDSHLICFDDVVLTVRGRAQWHLDSVVEPLTLPDLPVVVWNPKAILAPGDPLLATADRVLVDSRFLPQEDTLFVRLARLARRAAVTDLSWTRLTPWRSLLASLFDGSHIAFTRGVQHVSVAGHYGPRHLLGGWLLETLGLVPGDIELTEAEHVSLTIDAVAAGTAGRSRSSARGTRRRCTRVVEVAGEPTRKQTLHMRDQTRSETLADALGQTGREPAYRQALDGAIRVLESQA